MLPRNDNQKAPRYVWRHPPSQRIPRAQFRPNKAPGRSHQRDSQLPNKEWSYLKILYIPERLNHKFTNIFRKEGIPVRVTHRSYTLRRAPSHDTTEHKCTRNNCPISSTKLCLLRNAPYQITCNNCNQHYIGSTTRFIYDRVKEHLNNENSSVKKLISTSQNKDYKASKSRPLYWKTTR